MLSCGLQLPFSCDEIELFWIIRFPFDVLVNNVFKCCILHCIEFSSKDCQLGILECHRTSRRFQQFLDLLTVLSHQKSINVIWLHLRINSIENEAHSWLLITQECFRVMKEILWTMLTAGSPMLVQAVTDAYGSSIRELRYEKAVSSTLAVLQEISRLILHDFHRFFLIPARKRF